MMDRRVQQGPRYQKPAAYLHMHGYPLGCSDMPQCGTSVIFEDGRVAGEDFPHGDVPLLFRTSGDKQTLKVCLPYTSAVSRQITGLTIVYTENHAWCPPSCMRF